VKGIVFRLRLSGDGLFESRDEAGNKIRRFRLLELASVLNILYTQEVDKLKFYNNDGGSNRHCSSYMTIAN